ncbi:MAG: spore germination protein [Clostridia bacterium]|nr:spore germination protein [Clostridia bacterium]
MFKKFKFLKFLISQKPLKGQNSSQSQPPKSQQNLTANLTKNVELLKAMLGTSSDLVFHDFILGTEGRPKAVLILVDGLVDIDTVHEQIIKPLMIESRTLSEKCGIFPNYNIEVIKNTLITVNSIKIITTIEEAIDGVLSGNTVLLVNGLSDGLLISTQGGEIRGIKEPATDSVVRGPRDGFVENLRVNTALIRRRIKSPDLTIERMVIGRRTKTDVEIVYIKSLVKPGLVEEIKRRLASINTDAILESGYIEQFIEDAPFSPFSTVGNSERPDQVAAKLLEGRAAILVNGTPIALTVPYLFIESFQSVEDYYSRTFYVAVVRILRYVAFFISVFGPGTYVALVSFHQELIPTPLLITMAAARANTPFPAFLEAILMGVAFEILREAGIRLPRPVGTAISIVGALVIGEAVVSAGVISSTMVIVV